MGITSLYVREYLKMVVPQPSKDVLFHPSYLVKPVEEWTLELDENGKTVWKIGNFTTLCGSMVKHRKQLKHFKYWILTFRETLYKSEAFNNFEFMNLMSLESSLYKSMTFVLSAKTDPFSQASKVVTSNRNFMLKSIRRQPSIFRYVHELYNNDFEIVKTVVSSKSNSIKFACSELKDNDEIAKIVLMNNGQLITELSERIKGDSYLAMIAVTNCGLALEYLHENLKKDRTIVHAAVSSNGNSLKYAESYWSDREIVLTAVSSAGDALIFASDDLKKDREIVKTAVQQDKAAFACLYRARDPDIITRWGEDEEIVLLSRNLDNASERLKNDKEFILKFLEVNPNSYIDASPELKKDREIVLATVQKVGSMLEFMSTEFRCKDSHSREITITNRDIILTAVTNDGFALMFASAEWKNDFDIVMAAVRNDGLAIKYASNDMRDTMAIAVEAIKQNYHSLEYVSHRLQVSPEIIDLSQLKTK